MRRQIDAHQIHQPENAGGGKAERLAEHGIGLFHLQPQLLRQDQSSNTRINQ